jgi:hypothetical protein
MRQPAYGQNDGTWAGSAVESYKEPAEVPPPTPPLAKSTTRAPRQLVTWLLPGAGVFSEPALQCR